LPLQFSTHNNKYGLNELNFCLSCFNNQLKSLFNFIQNFNRFSDFLYQGINQLF
jgi:hypothetical protein